jgi:hypothetical protein
VARVQLTNDLPETCVGERIGQKDQGTEECEDRWAQADQSPDREQGGITLFSNELISPVKQSLVSSAMDP